jgi:hypothetical protein
MNLKDFGIRKPHETETLRQGDETSGTRPTRRTWATKAGRRSTSIEFRATNERRGEHVVVKIDAVSPI